MNLLVMYFLVNWMSSLLRASGLPIHIGILSTAVLNLGGVVGAIAPGRMVDRLDPHLVLGGAYAASVLFIATVAMDPLHRRGLGVERIGSIFGPVAGGLLLGAGWSAQSVVLVAVAPALLAAMAVVAPRGRGPLPAAISSSATLQH